MESGPAAPVRGLMGTPLALTDHSTGPRVRKEIHGVRRYGRVAYQATGTTRFHGTAFHGIYPSQRLIPAPFSVSRVFRP